MQRNIIELSHVFDSARGRPQRQIVALVTLTLFVGILIGALYLSQSASTSQLGRQLEALIVERTALEQANEQLRAEIASLQGVPRLRARALELDFRPAGRDDIEFVVVPSYNPNRQLTVAPMAEAREPEPLYEESFAGWLQAQFDSVQRQFEGIARETESGS